MVNVSMCLERSIGESTCIYGYNNEHGVIVYTVVKYTQNDYGQ